MIAIFYALKNEIDYFKRNACLKNEYKIENITFFEGTIDDTLILLVQTGIGVKNSEKATKIVLGKFDIDLIITTGFAGALKDFIAVGDMVYAKNILYANELENQNQITNIKYHSTPNFSMLIENICNKSDLNFHYGDIVTVDKVISNASKKSWLGSNSNAISVDMETFGIAETLSKKDIPFISIRSISDDVKSDLKMDNINDFIEEDGKINVKKAGINIAKNLKNVPNLMKLRKNAIIASRNIGIFLLSLIKEILKSDVILQNR